MSCGGGCCPKKNYNSDKPLSKRIPQVVLVFFVVWLIGFGFLAQTFNQPNKPKSKRRNKKRGYKEPGFFEKLGNELREGNLLIWGIILFIGFTIVMLIFKMISMQIKKTEAFIQDKWEEAMAQQEKRYKERMSGYNNSYDSDDDYEGPRIRELTTEEEEAHWRSLMEKERKEREKQLAEIEEEKKTR